MTTFPIELIPHQIQQAKLAQPSVPQCSAIEPRPPADFREIETPLPAKRLNQGIILFDLAVSIPLSYLMGNLLNIPVLVVLLLVLTAIGLYAGYKVKTYPRRKKEREHRVREIKELNRQEQSRYQTVLKKYESDRVTYTLANQDHQREIAKLLTPESVKEFQVNLIREQLRNTFLPDGINSDAQTGYCERRFGRYLFKYFSSGRIRTGLTLNIPNCDRTYSPDFVYIDPSLGIHIDIEIDEPYVFTNGNPTHYLYADRDNNRNNFFLNKGWIVIRFAEIQTVKYPDECCKLIAEIIHKYSGDATFISKFTNIGNLTPIRQWTEEEAIEMASNNYRGTYTDICQNG